MNIWLVSPPSYSHSKGLLHVAQSFADAYKTELTVGCIPPQGTTVVFGGHLLGSIEPNTIIYNTEQIGDGWLVRNPNYKGYFSILKQAKEVWDYSRNNIEALKKHGVVARLVEVGYMPGMTKRFPQLTTPVDVLFFGSTACERRMEVLSDLSKKCNLETVYDVYGPELDILIARSKIILNVHFYDTAIHEIFRTSYLMANRKFILSETGNDSQLDNNQHGIWFTPYEKIVDDCMLALEKPDVRESMAAQAFNSFSSRTQTDLLKEAGVL